MTSLSDKVARVINELDHAEGMAAPHPNHEGMETSLHFEGLLLEAKKLLAKLWDENQKQREVLERIAKGQNEQGISDLARHLRAMAQDCLTAIDNVMNK